MRKKRNFFKLSQFQHKRLMKKHRDCINQKKGDYDLHFTFLNYHSAVYEKQQKEKRIFSEKEKKTAYADVISSFY